MGPMGGVTPQPPSPGKNRPQPDRRATHHGPHDDGAWAPPKPKVDQHAAIRCDARTYVPTPTVTEPPRQLQHSAANSDPDPGPGDSTAECLGVRYTAHHLPR